MKYTPVIGLEIHIEPNTVSKMFCACPQDHFGKAANTQTCPICLGLPGALPYTNSEAVRKTIILGLALGAEINKTAKFYRKHYFYPDLPKAFQTSQKDEVLCLGGSLLGNKINHIHLEEDAGKLVHVEGASLVDFNRSGCALIEIVTEPVFHSTIGVLTFVKEIQKVSRYLNISNSDMEKGTMRLEANVSLSSDGTLPKYKVEIKNINSFRFLQNAINAELARQEEVLSGGGIVSQETRGYDENTQKTYSQRTKEEAQDYRYFPEADLPPLVSSTSELEEIKSQLLEMPDQKRARFTVDYGLTDAYAKILTEDRSRSEYFETAVTDGKKYDISAKTIATEMINHNLDKEFPEPSGLIKKLYEITQKTWSSYEDMENASKKALELNPKVKDDYEKGKGQVVGFLIGQAQKELKGNGDPGKLGKIIIKLLQGHGGSI